MRHRAALALGLSITLASCAPDLSSSHYTSTQVGSINRAVRGRIVSVRMVTVHRSTGVGGTAGAGVGAVAGASLGSNTEGSIAGAIIGTVVGGVAVAAVERDASRTTAFEYVVTTENGAMMTLVQGAPALDVGAKVIVLYGSPARLIADAGESR